jgi:hypothetical protein
MEKLKVELADRDFEFTVLSFDEYSITFLDVF